MPRHFTEEISAPRRSLPACGFAFNDASAFHRGNLQDLAKVMNTLKAPSMMPRHFTEEIKKGPNTTSTGNPPSMMPRHFTEEIYKQPGMETGKTNLQ